MVSYEKQLMIPQSDDSKAAKQNQNWTDDDVQTVAVHFILETSDDGMLYGELSEVISALS